MPCSELGIFSFLASKKGIWKNAICLLLNWYKSDTKKVKHIYFKSFIDNADIINTHNYFTSYSEFFILKNSKWRFSPLKWGFFLSFPSCDTNLKLKFISFSWFSLIKSYRNEVLRYAFIKNYHDIFSSWWQHMSVDSSNC